MGRALSADKASALRPTGDQGLCKHPDVPRQPSEAGLSGRKKVGLSVLRTDSEPCEVFGLAQRTGFRRLVASGSQHTNIICLPARHTDSLTPTHNSNKLQRLHPNKNLPSQHSFLNRSQLLRLPSTTSPATPTATDCVTQAEISPSLNST